MRISPLTVPRGHEQADADHPLTIARINAKDEIHGAVFEPLLQTLSAEAELHGTVIDESQFTHVISAIKEGDLSSYILMGRTIQGVTQFAGGAVQFPSLCAEFNELRDTWEYFPADASEDLYIHELYSKAFRAKNGQMLAKKPDSNVRGVGLSYILQRIVASAKGRVKERPFGMVAMARKAEHATDNPSIHAIYKKLDAIHESDPNRAVLTFMDGPIISPKSDAGLDVVTLFVPKKGGYDIKAPSIFVITWKNNKSLRPNIVLTVTKGFSTYLGRPVTVGDFSSVGKLPCQKKLGVVLASMIEAAREVATHREWYTPYTGSPIVTHNSLRLNALKEDAIHHALREEVGAIPRQLSSNCIVCPTIVKYRNIPQDLLGHQILPDPVPFNTHSTPLRTLRKVSSAAVGESNYGSAGSSGQFPVHALNHC